MKKKKTACGEQSRTVFVGMSGGVDSSVSAALLKEQGFNVVGVFIKTWHPDFLVCNEEEERRDAMRVCAHLDIPFLTFDFEKIYKKEVADYMIAEYKQGRTPNPDVMCNKEIKFGAFLKKVLAMGADYVATGHYAQTCDVSSHFSSLRPSLDYKGGALGKLKMKRNVTCLCKGIDSTKDQSYFLWTLKKEQLSKILFPVGNLEKKQVRILAKKFKLPVAEKKDSQGICFLGVVDLKEFLKHYIKEKKGDVVIVPSESERGKKQVIGFHNGVVFHTLGERHGFTVTKKSPNDAPYYVVAKDIKKNILYVSQNINKNKDYSYSFKDNFCLILNNTNWVSVIPEENKNYTAQIRYHGEFLICQIKKINKKEVKVVFDRPILVDRGQSCVIYDKDVVLGGGVIK
ncbi:MAG: tRNA 2-thiouridine(34) synthase MnmA [bacterium]